jgi:hypothetical protein
MPRTKFVLVICGALIATGAAAAHADQWTDANLRRAQVNTRQQNLNARHQADHMPSGAHVVVAPNGIQRSRTEHGALTNQSNALRNQSLR